MTDGLGADGVIICGGGDEVFTQAVDMVRYGIGTVSNVNYYGGTGSHRLPEIFRRQRHGRKDHPYGAGQRRPRPHRAYAENGSVQGGWTRGKMVTHRLHGLDKVEAALELMHHKPKDLVKVMVQND